MDNEQFEIHEGGLGTTIQGPIQSPIEQFNSFKEQLNLDVEEHRLAEYTELLQTRSRLQIEYQKTLNGIKHIDSEIQRLDETRAENSARVAQLRSEVDPNTRLLNVARSFKDTFFPEPESSELAEAKRDAKTNESSGTTHSSISNVARAKNASGKLLRRLSSRSSVTTESKNESSESLQEESTKTPTQSGVRQFNKAELEAFINDKQINLEALIDLCGGTANDENPDSYTFELTKIEAKIESLDAGITEQIKQTQESIAAIELEIQDSDNTIKAQEDVKKNLVSNKQEQEQQLQELSDQIEANKPTYTQQELVEIKGIIANFDNLITAYEQGMDEPSYANFVGLYNSISTKAQELHGIITVASENAYRTAVQNINALKEQLFESIRHKLSNEFTRIPEVTDGLEGSTLKDLEVRINRLNQIRGLCQKEAKENEIQFLQLVAYKRQNRRVELTNQAKPIINYMVSATRSKITNITKLLDGIKQDLRNEKNIDHKRSMFAEQYKSISTDLEKIQQLCNLFAIKLNSQIPFLYGENEVGIIAEQVAIESRTRRREIKESRANTPAPTSSDIIEEQGQSTLIKVKSDRQSAHIAKANLKLKIILGCSIALMIGSALILAALVAPEHMPQVITNVVTGLAPTAYNAILGCTISVGAISVASAGFSLFPSCRNSKKEDGCGILIPACTGL